MKNLQKNNLFIIKNYNKLSNIQIYMSNIHTLTTLEQKENDEKNKVIKQAGELIDIYRKELYNNKTKIPGFEFVINKQSNHIDNINKEKEQLNKENEQLKNQLQKSDKITSDTSSMLLCALDELGKPLSDTEAKRIEEEFTKKYLKNIK